MPDKEVGDASILAWGFGRVTATWRPQLSDSVVGGLLMGERHPSRHPLWSSRFGGDVQRSLLHVSKGWEGVFARATNGDRWGRLDSSPAIMGASILSQSFRRGHT